MIRCRLSRLAMIKNNASGHRRTYSNMLRCRLSRLAMKKTYDERPAYRHRHMKMEKPLLPPECRERSRFLRRSSANACGCSETRLLLTKRTHQDSVIPKYCLTHYLPVPPNEMEKLFTPPEFRRSPLGSEDLFERRRKEF